jgi:uncharacterized integral membrane protein
MTIEREPQRNSEDHGPPRPPRTWILPLTFLVVILVPVLVLIFSNAHSATLEWAAWEITAPLWIVLAVAFVAGAVGIRLFGWIWSGMRRRSLRRKAEFRQAHYGGGED